MSKEFQIQPLDSCKPGARETSLLIMSVLINFAA
jgi:hypothetical protein